MTKSTQSWWGLPNPNPWFLEYQLCNEIPYYCTRYNWHVIIIIFSFICAQKIKATLARVFVLTTLYVEGVVFVQRPPAQVWRHQFKSLHYSGPHLPLDNAGTWLILVADRYWNTNRSALDVLHSDNCKYVRAPRTSGKMTVSSGVYEKWDRFYPQAHTSLSELYCIEWWNWWKAFSETSSVCVWERSVRSGGVIRRSPSSWRSSRISCTAS